MLLLYSFQLRAAASILLHPFALRLELQHTTVTALQRLQEATRLRTPAVQLSSHAVHLIVEGPHR